MKTPLREVEPGLIALYVHCLRYFEELFFDESSQNSSSANFVENMVRLEYISYIEWGMKKCGKLQGGDGHFLLVV